MLRLSTSGCTTSTSRGYNYAMAANNSDSMYQQLVEKIAPHCRLLRSWRLTGGISAQMTALEIEHPGGQTQKLVVRRPGVSALIQNPYAAEDEFKLLQIAQSLGLASPVPVALDSSGAIFSTPVLVTEYAAGEMEFAPADPQNFAVQMAAHLVQIHSVAGERADLAFLPRQLRDLKGIIGRRPRASNPSFNEEDIRGTLERAWPDLKPNPPSLLHGDYWPGNILWQGEQLAAVIDWEDACTGDPLSDLAIARLDMLWIIGRDAMHAFTRHYQSSMALDYASLPYWDLCAALRLVRLAGTDLAGWAAYFHPYGRRDITPSSIRAHYHFFIQQAFTALAQC